MHKMHNKNAKLFIAKFPLDLYAFFLFSQHITEPQKRIIENLNSFPCCSVESSRREILYPSVLFWLFFLFAYDIKFGLSLAGGRKLSAEAGGKSRKRSSKYFPKKLKPCLVCRNGPSG